VAEKSSEGEAGSEAVNRNHSSSMEKRTKVVIQGIVQGVGFRPFIYQLARQHHLAGYVTNDSRGVEVEVEGEPSAIDRFCDAVTSRPPPLAHIDSIHRTEIPPKNDTSFQIEASKAGDERTTLISPDVCICSDCLQELTDPGDRRYRYPFINCTNCGPRYTIIRDIPYDRAATTMDAFPMCPDCQAEYDDPANRRFHAQPNACWCCGPTVILCDNLGNRIPCEDPVREAVALLEQGAILAVKGLGGFHLAVDAATHNAVVRVRRKKHREEKPFALMVRDLDTAHEIVHLRDPDIQTLTSPQRPIVILRKRRFHRLSPQVAPRNRHFGIMLPYTPLHVLLMQGSYKALVMTSGNMTEEPITIDNREAFLHLGDIAEYFLIHNREIYLRSDDSVVRVVDGVPRQIRRSRGYVPVPVFLAGELSKFPPVLALGGELKNTLCVTKENRAFLSQHIGDIENLETLEFFHMTVAHLKRILEIRPQVVACDLHPNYLSSQYAREQQDLPTVAVQHHHAHIVSCLAEHGIQGPVIGLAMDGTGYGTDRQIWGGEVLLCDLTSFQRAAHLDYVPLPGGDAAAKFPWRMALAYLEKAYGDRLFDLPLEWIGRLDPDQSSIVLQMARRRFNSPWTSSCGRLFDAVSSLVGLRDRTAYEGQAAIELEMCQSPNESGAYPWRVQDGSYPWIMETTPLIRGVVDDLQGRVSRGRISGRFHNTLIEMFSDVCIRLREETGIDRVAMSGGSFQNVTLLTGLTRRLTSHGFSVYTHSLVPTNDGCLALGQAVCAGLRHAGEEGIYGRG
jgi:hydrogenase maturation protein HypF